MENKLIAEAKALTYYQENPIPKYKDTISQKNMPLMPLTDEEMFEVWEKRDAISQENWKIQKIEMPLIFLISILSGMGTAIFVFLFLTIIPILVFIFIPYCWRFFLKRISELSQAIQGKK